MSDVLIRTIDAAHAADACLPNEPFRLWGRMIPSLKRGKWGYETEVFELLPLNINQSSAAGVSSFPCSAACSSSTTV